MCIFYSFYSLHSYNLSFLICLCFNMVSFRDQKKLGPCPHGSLLYVEFPPPQPVSSPTSFPHPLLTLFVALLLGELNGEA